MSSICKAPYGQKRSTCGLLSGNQALGRVKTFSSTGTSPYLLIWMKNSNGEAGIDDMDTGKNESSSVGPKEDRKVALSRAQRFAIQANIRFRVRGERLWREGVTENISNTGLLFRSNEMVQKDSMVEMTIDLPAGSKFAGNAKMICQGKVIRSWEYVQGFGALTAVNIKSSRLTRR